MANLQERRDKDGKLISYSIRIYRGRSQDGKQQVGGQAVLGSQAL